MFEQKNRQIFRGTSFQTFYDLRLFTAYLYWDELFECLFRRTEK
jgi:hypothetical protein